MPPQASLKPLLEPASIAILGASSDPTRIGGRPLAYLKRGGFAGPLYPVNPNRTDVQGLPAYPDLAAVPGKVDFALIAVPAAAVSDAVDACIAKGVGAACIFSSGFAEHDADGATLQARIADRARAAGLRLLGPNCLGLFNATLGFFCSFTSTMEQALPVAGPVGLVSQSGAYGSHVLHLASRRGIGLKHWVTTGNECDVETGEVLAYLAADPDVRVIVGYIEGIRDRDSFLGGLAAARAAGKPVVLMKVGRSAVGAAAAASHTASLAGADAVYDAVFRQFGAYRAATTEELLDVTYACTRGIFPAGGRLGLITISGGVGVQMADAAESFGLEVPEMPAAAQAELKALLPFAAVRNPVDVTAQAFNDLGLVGRNLEVMLRDGGYDAVIAFFTMVAGAPTIAPKLREAFAAASARYPERLLILSIIASSEVVRDYERAGYLVFEDPTRAVAAVAALVRFGRQQARPPRPVPAVPALPPLPSGALSEHAAKAILAAAGLPVPGEVLVDSAAAAVEAAGRIGYPVVLKLVSPDIPHKTEIGGVLLGLADAAAVRAGHATLLERARDARPDARLEGVLVAPQIGGGVECILGVSADPVFGPVVMAGLGGIFVEVLRDVSFRLAPFGIEEAHEMIAELRGRALLDGARGAPPADIAALAEALSRLSLFAAAHADRLQAVDINPMLVRPRGQGAAVLDAVVIARAGAGARPDDLPSRWEDEEAG